MSKDIDQKTALFHLLRDMGKVMRLFQNEAVLCEGVTFVQFCILDYAVEQGGRLELSELHALLSVEKSTTTRMVDPLVKRGLVVRGKSEHDSRAVALVLTTKGKSVHGKVWDCISVFIDNVLHQMPNNRRTSVLEALGDFVRSIRQCCGGRGCG